MAHGPAWGGASSGAHSARASESRLYLHTYKFAPCKAHHASTPAKCVASGPRSHRWEPRREHRGCAPPGGCRSCGETRMRRSRLCCTLPDEPGLHTSSALSPHARPQYASLNTNPAARAQALSASPIVQAQGAFSPRLVHGIYRSPASRRRCAPVGGGPRLQCERARAYVRRARRRARARGLEGEGPTSAGRAENDG